MNWDHLKTFGVLAETQNLSEAARRLGLSPATVGRHVATLEADLGTVLFDHLPEGYALTVAGHQFVPLAADMAAAAARIDRKRAALDDSADAVVRVTAGNWASRFLLQRLSQAPPIVAGVQLEMINAYDFASLARRDADIAIRNRRPETGKLALRRLPAFKSAVYGHCAFVDQWPAARSADRYDRCRWVGFDSRLAHLPSARWLAERRTKPPEIRCLQAINVLDAVLGGAGLALLPCFAGEAEQSLVRLTDTFVIEGAESWLVIHEDLRRRPTIRAVCDWIVQSMTSEPWSVRP